MGNASKTSSTAPAPSAKDQQWWEDYFAPGGGWETNGGREQTRIFAEHCTRHARMDRAASFTLLDVGCALGEALRHFRSAFPNASLHGVDFSHEAIRRCRQELDGLAKFEVRGIDSLEGQFDVIYISNVLEHFADFQDKTRRLLRHCQRLWIMVPFHELKNGRPIEPNPSEHHQHTFERDSFDFTTRENLARSITSHVFSCPGAWPARPSGPIKRARRAVKNMFRRMAGFEPLTEPRQILFDIAK